MMIEKLKLKLRLLRLKVPPPLQVTICAGLMWMLATYMPIMTGIIAFHLYIAAVFVVNGLVFIVPPVVAFIRAKTTVHPMHPQKSTVLVTDGLYAFSRNPMYVGLWFLLNALGLYFDAISPFFVVPCFIVYIEQFQIIPEEEALEQLFGDSYEQYKQKVKRWL